MTEDQLSPNERQLLLKEARQALASGVSGNSLEPLNLETYPLNLRQLGVAFVTLTIDGQLRGCVGALDATRPLIEDVREHALAAALKDYRFSPVKPVELQDISIEISRLTTPVPLDYDNPDDLIAKLRPGIDGVVLKDGLRRATFLPQVWEKLPSTVTFLEHLCQKMGVSPDLWRHQKLNVLIYQVEEFHEDG